MRESWWDPVWAYLGVTLASLYKDADVFSRRLFECSRRVNLSLQKLTSGHGLEDTAWLPESRSHLLKGKLVFFEKFVIKISISLGIMRRGSILNMVGNVYPPLLSQIYCKGTCKAIQSSWRVIFIFFRQLVSFLKTTQTSHFKPI